MKPSLEEILHQIREHVKRTGAKILPTENVSRRMCGFFAYHIVGTTPSSPDAMEHSREWEMPVHAFRRQADRILHPFLLPLDKSLQVFIWSIPGMKREHGQPPEFSCVACGLTTWIEDYEHTEDECREMRVEEVMGA